MSSFERVILGLIAVAIGIITIGVGLFYPDWHIGIFVVISGFMTLATGGYTILNNKTWGKYDGTW